MKQAELGDDELRAEISRLEALINAGIKKDQDVDELNKLRHTARAFRNRLAAKKSRITKRMSVKDMEKRLQALEKENLWLRLQISASDLSSTSTALQSCSGSNSGGSIIGASSQDRSDDEMTFCDALDRPSPCPPPGSA
jgi:predicted DNA binding CopG/RHH family protein